MKVVIFGATGMVGQGVLRECLMDGGITDVMAIVRTPTGRSDPKLTELVRSDFMDYTAIGDRLTGVDACFFCLGISSVGMNEADYRRITFEIPLAAARALLQRNPAMAFIYVSGRGADSKGTGRVMWARVKGEAENAILSLGFRTACVFRPGYIQPLHGVSSRTPWIRAAYAVLAPFYPLIKALAPNTATTTEQIGKAMIAIARRGAPKPVLENRDINLMSDTAASDGRAVKR